MDDLMFERIDILRLSGVDSLLGLEFSDSGVKVVELAKRGNLLNKFKAAFSVRSSFEVNFNPADSLQSRAEALAGVLEQHNVKCRKGFATIPPEHVRVAEATLPPSADRPDEWITDHLDEILKLPIQPHEITFAYERLADDTEARLRIAFVRKEYLDGLLDVCKHAKVELTGMGLAGEGGVTGALPGIDKSNIGPATAAFRGFFPHTGKIDFLPKTMRESFETGTFSSLFQRTVITCGVLSIALLIIPFLGSQYLSIRETENEEKLLAMGRAYSEVQSLERQVEELRRQVSSEGRNFGRSDVTRLLHAMAKSAPEGLWFTSLTYSEEPSSNLTIRVLGYARAGTEISTFMKNLERNRISRNLRLVRSEHMNERSQAMVAKSVPRSFVLYEIIVDP